jgi:phosphatidate cytidylyltransferase
MFILAYSGGWILFLGILASLLLCLHELYEVLALRGHRPIEALGVLIGVTFIVGVQYDPRLIYASPVICIVGGGLLFLARRTLFDVISTAVGAIYVTCLLGFAILIRELQGFQWFLLVIWGVGSADVFAYAVGSTIGKHKLAPRISPSKTWEGLLGGLIGCLLMVVALNEVFHILHGGDVLLFAVVFTGCDLAGDLLASAVKRYARVKDYSALIPGHGGLLDRIDGLLFAFPVAYVLIHLVTNLW